MTTLLISIPLFLVSVLGLGIGYFIRKRPLCGSCGNCAACILKRVKP
jgi:hypothetical protein